MIKMIRRAWHNLIIWCAWRGKVMCPFCYGQGELPEGGPNEIYWCPACNATGVKRDAPTQPQ